MSDASAKAWSAISDVASVLAIVGAGSIWGVVKLYFLQSHLPRALLVVLDDLLKDMEESADFVGRQDVINQLSTTLPLMLQQFIRWIDQRHGSAGGKLVAIELEAALNNGQPGVQECLVR
jgi:hypothetical protein